MGKTSDLFKKIRDTQGESQGQGSLVGCRLWDCTESDTTEVTQLQQQGTFHTKMGTIKDRNGMNLTEAEDIKRW